MTECVFHYADGSTERARLPDSEVLEYLRFPEYAEGTPDFWDAPTGALVGERVFKGTCSSDGTVHYHEVMRYTTELGSRASLACAVAHIRLAEQETGDKR